MSTVAEWKDQGNAEFRAGRFKKAAELYSKAIELDSESAVLYSNRANAYLQLSKYQQALADAEKCSSLTPEWSKGWYRKAAVLEAQGEREKALSAYQQALQCEPQNKEVQTKVRSLKQQLAKDKKHSKRQSTPQPGPMPARQQQPAAAFGAQGAMADTCAAQGGVPGPASWSVGLPPAKQAEWLVDCYRMRVDDDYAWGGGQLRGLYDPDSTTESILEDFLLFCKLAVMHSVVPPGWSWSKFLTAAAKLLPYAFEKSDAQEKWGGENVFAAAMGGRSLRYTGEVVYGSSTMGGGEQPQEARELHRQVMGHWGVLVSGSPEGEAVFADVGGVAAWRKLHSSLRLVR